MMDIAARNRAYWTERAPSYTADVATNVAHGGRRMWADILSANLPEGESLRILDIGTGPGFFAILLTEMGHRVTAADYTPAMLEEARRNAGALAPLIEFRQMDAQALDFPDNTFDVVVSRNLTWNLPHPEQAYREWFRVLKSGGRMINFDADWYGYLFDESKREAVREDRRHVAEEGCTDYNAYAKANEMEEISRQLPMGRYQRPQWDVDTLTACGFARVETDTEVWRITWDNEEKVNFAATPGFMILADKGGETPEGIPDGAARRH